MCVLTSSTKTKTFAFSKVLMVNIIMYLLGNGWKAAHHMCLSCGVQFTGSRNGSRTRTVSLKRMRKKLAYLQSKPSTSNHIVAPSLASQKQVQCFLVGSHVL